MSVSEVASVLKCSTTWCRHLARSGRIYAEDSGGVWLFYSPAVFAFLLAPPLAPGRKSK